MFPFAFSYISFKISSCFLIFFVHSSLFPIFYKYPFIQFSFICSKMFFQLLIPTILSISFSYLYPYFIHFFQKIIHFLYSQNAFNLRNFYSVSPQSNSYSVVNIPSPSDVYTVLSMPTDPGFSYLFLVHRHSHPLLAFKLKCNPLFTDFLNFTFSYSLESHPSPYFNTISGLDNFSINFDLILYRPPNTFLVVITRRSDNPHRYRMTIRSFITLFTSFSQGNTVYFG